MAYIQKVKRKQDINYRVFIKAGSKRITKTFNSKRAAVQFANAIESDRNKLLAYTQSKSRTLLSIVIDKYLSSEYKGTRVNDERRKLSFWLEAVGGPKMKLLLLINLPSQMKRSLDLSSS
ncbi:hypothetical protein OAI02_06040 [Candidatus Pseudothioglobus singularis]|nr:hypothetical protein [Candidatus Pseudothioglobus singularis]MDB4848035.1 hypothetical protein [Candidatus Pseudothioglobus singularis]